MSVHIAIVDGPIGADRPPLGGPAGPGVGAVLVFEGVVRSLEDGTPIAALDYQAYEPMATRQMESIARSLVAELGLASIHAWHSRGRVGAGQCSLRVEIRSAHRAEGLTAMARFIDQLKRDVPIWKQVVWA